MNKLNKYNTSFLVDGSFLPIRNGTNYSIYHLMNSLHDTGMVNSSLVVSYRGWDNPVLYFDQKFNTIFLPSEDYYRDTGVLEYVFDTKNINIVHIYNAEEILNMGARLRKSGVKVIFEVINVDHILYSQFSDDKEKTSQIMHQQKEAAEAADHVMCRSGVDRQHLLNMGVDQDKITVYRGAMDTSAIKYQPRVNPRYKLIFLGHMYYPPNEESLKLIVEKVLPKLLKLDKRYSVTIVGNTPKSTVKRYGEVKGLIFNGGMDDLSDLLFDYDIGIAPIYQGSGTRLKVLDYLSSGLPVITTNLGVEGLIHDISKYVVIEDNIEEYSGRIHELMETLDKHKNISARGRKFVETNYDWKNNLDPFLETYKKLTNKKQKWKS